MHTAMIFGIMPNWRPLLLLEANTTCAILLSLERKENHMRAVRATGSRTKAKLMSMFAKHKHACMFTHTHPQARMLTHL